MRIPSSVVTPSVPIDRHLHFEEPVRAAVEGLFRSAVFLADRQPASLPTSHLQSELRAILVEGMRRGEIARSTEISSAVLTCTATLVGLVTLNCGRDLDDRAWFRITDNLLAGFRPLGSF